MKNVTFVFFQYSTLKNLRPERRSTFGKKSIKSSEIKCHLPKDKANTSRVIYYVILALYILTLFSSSIPVNWPRKILLHGMEIMRENSFPFCFVRFFPFLIKRKGPKKWYDYTWLVVFVALKATCGGIFLGANFFPNWKT